MKKKKLLSSQNFWKRSLLETPLIIFTLQGAPWRESLCSASLFGKRQWVTCMENDVEPVCPSLGKRRTARETLSEKLLSLQTAPTFPPRAGYARVFRILCSGCNTWTVLLSNPFVSDSPTLYFPFNFSKSLDQLLSFVTGTYDVYNSGTMETCRNIMLLVSLWTFNHFLRG